MQDFTIEFYSIVMAHETDTHHRICKIEQFILQKRENSSCIKSIDEIPVVGNDSENIQMSNEARENSHMVSLPEKILFPRRVSARYMLPVRQRRSLRHG